MNGVDISKMMLMKNFKDILNRENLMRVVYTTPVEFFHHFKRVERMQIDCCNKDHLKQFINYLEIVCYEIFSLESEIYRQERNEYINFINKYFQAAKKNEVSIIELHTILNKENIKIEDLQKLLNENNDYSKFVLDVASSFIEINNNFLKFRDSYIEIHMVLDKMIKKR